LLEALVSHGPKTARYSIEGELARGGMGTILHVWDKDLRRRLAMKVILGWGHAGASAGGGNAESKRERALARFLEEAQVTGQLDHPGIVPVHELGIDADGRVYFTMKLVKGRSLRAIFDLVFAGAEGWNETRALGVVLKTCEAMAYAHAKGVIHRDLKPGNIMVGNFGEVYVMDWGLARVLGREDKHDLRLATEAEPLSSIQSVRREVREEAPDSPIFTMDGDIVGTPSYMPPEQARGEVDRLSPRSDVYSIGATLYHLLARQMPFLPPGAHVNGRMVLMRLIEGPPVALARLRPDLPSELVAIVEKAMARDPAQRYPDTLALAEDLRAYLEHRVVRAYQTGAVAELSKWIERNRGLAAAGALAFLLLVAGLSASLVLRSRAERNAADALQNAARADAAAGAAEKRADEVLKLSALQELDDLVADADRLWPAVPEHIAGYEAWLARADKILAELPAYRRQWSERAARGRPASESERARSFTADEERAQKLDALAWISLELGRFEGAVTDAEQAVAVAPAGRRPAHEAQLAALQAEIERRIEREPAPDPALEERARELRAELAPEEEELVFASPEDLWWHGQLKKLVTGLEALADPRTGLIAGTARAEGWSVTHRLEWARGLEAASLTGPDAARRWSEACASIADPEQCPQYNGLAISPQLGLLPIGRDPQSGLWEFAHLATGPAPSRAADGHLVLEERTGLVLVLIPGGTFHMGSQKRVVTAPNFYGDTYQGEWPVHEVELSPYFLSKYEMTQAQWLAVLAVNPSYRNPGSVGEQCTLRNPVENANWNLCAEVCRQLGLALPTEAQWECAARGGTTTPWWSGEEKESLRGAANLADQAAQRRNFPWPDIKDWPDLDDGWAQHAPVGTYRANPFGLHDTAGNVWEWCQDDYDTSFYARSPRLDPLCPPTREGPRVMRGGAHNLAAMLTRSAFRYLGQPGSADGTVGLRPSRALTR